MRLFAKNSIGSKILVAFLAMGGIVGAIGAYGYWVLTEAGDIVVQTYDGPLMSINFARAASLDFAHMQNLTLERRLVPPDKKIEIDGALEETATTFFEDLAVARDRSNGDKQLAIIAQIDTLVADWVKARAEMNASIGTQEADEKLEALGAQILERFDMLIEVNTGDSFVGRRKAVWSIADFKAASVGVTGVALILAIAITWMLARKIVRPLSAAAAVADQIAGGELHTPIPTGAEDETGTLLRSMTVMQDNIREMVERETARAQSAEARLIEALENSGEGIVLADSTEEVIVANSQVFRFFPNMPTPLTGLQFDTVLRLFDGALPPQEELSLPLASAAKFDPIVSITAERRLEDGRWVRFDGHRTSEGGSILLLRDFSEFKYREANLRMAKQAAEEANEAKSRFLANMSHELRTPLNAIIGFSEIITNQMFGAIANTRYVDYGKDIVRSGRHLLDIINSVLDLARSEAGKMPLDPKIVDVRDVLVDCAKMIREQCKDADLVLVVPYWNEPLFVLGESAKLRQIFLNLLSNAVKFTEPGGMISIELDLEAIDSGRWLSVTITDTGIGMSADDVKVALTPFGQVDNRLERKYEGTGLGLPLTKVLVELHGGALLIESERERGTCVTVRLPRAEIASASPALGAA